ncbi:histidine--tRNA ligase [Bowdeniella nasicola]|uniref:Histidine--tRNA ligase n=1 Tax=Bowdeniella nasicola TaxID=208480 RepID=A0A1Q5Q0Z6_9ACTO|nr:histidine--tRNA ligase [Bowdeniella nasicola]OKL53518.1 histidine--tRNA ligase [Bowdeniella nasicola]
MVRSSLSGFPELLPAERFAELSILDTLRHTFELHGFSPLETRAVETLDTLAKKGETSKEVYSLSRVNAQAGDKVDSLGLHFDLTVPFARYVVENSGHLVFPFKRYQIQKVWRGERPQEGRFREFTQADIDVVGQDTLPFHYEVELPLVMAEALAQLNVGQFLVQVNNRKVCEGFYRGLGIEDVAGTLRTIDKLDKIGAENVARVLVEEIGTTSEQAEAALRLAEIAGDDAAAIVDQVRSLGVTHHLLTEGLGELHDLLAEAQSRRPGAVRAVLKIARGLDYYTGSVYETLLVDHEDLGSVGGGGRYDSLATSGKKTYPGVGVSIGVTRLLSRLLRDAEVSRPVATTVLVAVANEEDRHRSNVIAQALRERGIPADVAPSAAKFGKQIRYADRLGIPFVWFPGDNQVKDIRSGEQLAADPITWAPPADDLYPRTTFTQGVQSS